MMLRLLSLPRTEWRLPALGWVLRVFLFKTLARHGKASMPTKIAVLLRHFARLPQASMPRCLPVN
jgi:hypothetical protein